MDKVFESSFAIMTITADCSRASYLPTAVERHTTEDDRAATNNALSSTDSPLTLNLHLAFYNFYVYTVGCSGQVHSFFSVVTLWPLDFVPWSVATECLSYAQAGNKQHYL